jgi:hypothetical protein
MKRAICILALGLAPGLVSAGCGGGDDSTPTTIPSPTTGTPKQLSKEQFIAQGDGFCAEVNAALGGLSADSGSEAAQAASLYKGLLEHLRGLGTPDDATGLDEFLSAGDDLVSAEEAADQAVQDKNDAALASAESDAASAQAAFSSAASSYGFEECGQGPNAPSTTASGTAPVVPPTSTAPVPAPTTTVPVVPAAPAPTPGATGAGGGTAGTGGGSTGTGGTTGGSGGVGPG